MRPVDGDHVYVLAPDAVSVNGVPGQYVDDEVGVTTVAGMGLTVTGTVAVLEQPVVAASVIVTVYVSFAVRGPAVVEALVGLAIRFVLLALFLHEYVTPGNVLVASRLADEPEQITTDGFTTSGTAVDELKAT